MSRSAAYTERSSVWGFYVHDDWRLRGNFTLNARRSATRSKTR